MRALCIAMSALLLLANTALSGPVADFEKFLRDAHADYPGGASLFQ